MEKPGVVSQKLFANWETDRTSSGAIHRVVSFGISRLCLAYPTQPGNAIVLTAKLQGNKRTLRSNEISVTLGGTTVDVDLDVTFTIHYPHYIKHKNNILQIMVQRKRKYKNRPIPGGFKTLATGIINLSQLLQHSGLREVLLFTSEDIDKEGTVTSIGRLNLTACQTSPAEFEDSKLGKKIITADDDEEDTDSEYDDVVDDTAGPSSGRGGNRMNPGMNSKQLRRKNLKQRFVNLLRKFKAAEEQGTTEGVPSRAGSVLGAPTAQELEALFEELEDMSDSDPVEWNDDVSIRSNPRPALRPYFTRSKEVLPAILDQDFYSESENEPTDLELSSDDKEIATRFANSRDGPIQTQHTMSTPRSQSKVSNTVSVPLAGTSISMGVPHSQTMGSINKKDSKILENSLRQINLQEELPRLLDNVSHPVKLWLCATEASHLAPLGLPLVYCTSMATAKIVINQVVHRIQAFCNTNSENPPVHLIGIIGSDKTISHVVRAYVEIFNMKSSCLAMPFIRFVMIPPPQSLIHHLLDEMDPIPDDLCRDIWDRFAELHSEDQANIGIRLEKFVTQATGVLNIPYGEVMMQMAEGNEYEANQVFVPFLSEVRMGQTDDDFESSSPRIEELDKSRDFTLSGSPPHSPHIKTDTCDLNLEYWLADPEGSKKDKGSLKTAFRSVLIARVWNQPHLYLNFVKEKRKEKMLQKLGMKKGQRSEADYAPVHVTNVSRLLCIGSGKNTDLTVTVDGNQYRNIRYFQTTAQWQTHVKTFPIVAQFAASNLSYM